MLWGETWNPVMYLEVRHPDVAVIDTDQLPPGVLGAIDHTQRAIWLATGLPDHVRRCTLAFEIGHLEAGPSRGDHQRGAALDAAAAEWAARQLVPFPELCMALAATCRLPAHQANTAVARMLGVDVATVRARRRSLTDAEQDAAIDACRGLPVAV